MKLYYIICVGTPTKNHPIVSFIGCELMDVFGRNKKLLYSLCNDPFLGTSVTVYDIMDAIKNDKEVQALAFKTKEDVSDYMKNHSSDFSDISNPEATWNYKHSILEVEI